MESSTRGDLGPVTADAVAVSRIKTLAVLLVLTALPGVVLGLLWQGPEQSNQLYSHAEIAPDRDLWWGVLMSFAVLLSVSVPLQALATLLLVRARGSRWATIGGVLMWIGAGVQAAGLAGWAAAYFFPTDPAVGVAAGRAVIEVANADEAHLVALVPIGMGLVVLGTVLQCVGLFRAKVVPTWLPVAALFVMLTFVVPGYGIASLIASVPMAAAAVGFAYYAVRSVRPPRPHLVLPGRGSPTPGTRVAGRMSNRVDPCGHQNASRRPVRPLPAISIEETFDDTRQPGQSDSRVPGPAGQLGTT